MSQLDIDYKYLISNERDKIFGSFVTTIGYQSVKANSPYPVKGHPSGYSFNVEYGRTLHEYQLLYISKGEGSFVSASKKKCKLERGNVLLLVPGEWHSYCPDTETGWDEYYIGFNGSMIDNLFTQNFFPHKCSIYEMGFSEEFIKLYHKAIAIAKSDRMATQQYLGGIVMQMLGMLLYTSQNKLYEKSEMEQRIARAKMIMQENIFSNVDPEKLAKQMNISYSWFRKEFKTYTGYAPARYFQELKIQKAKELIVSTSQTVKEIAFALGYGSTEHFSTLFKKRTNYTPLEYRIFGRKNASDFYE